MAHFRATIQGQRGEASRLGSEKSGIMARVNGWTAGVRVDASVTIDREDRFYIFATRGSSPLSRDVLLGYVDASGTFHPDESLFDSVFDAMLGGTEA